VYFNPDPGNPQACVLLSSETGLTPDSSKYWATTKSLHGMGLSGTWLVKTLMVDGMIKVK
jgi:hypothetical protein